MRDPRRCVVLKCGELVLKGRNRWRFEAALRANLRAALDPVGRVRITRREGVFLVSGDFPYDVLLDRCRDTIGVTMLHPAVRAPRSVEAAGRAAVGLVAEATDRAGVRTFAVRARRRDKTFPLTSEQVGARVGAAVNQATGLAVDLTNPDLEIGVEVDQREILVYTDRIPGQGGLPVGSTGRALVLLSGGYDSPVAAHRAMRRGLQCDFVHFTGLPFADPRSVYKAYALVRQLGRYQPAARLLVVALGRAQRALAAAGAGKLGIVAQRRLMVMTASRLARRHGADALVTGDSLGQVASQTLQNLVVVEEAADLPLLRPLLGFDKNEIMAEAERIGTRAVSELPDEDCCSMLVHPITETRAELADLTRLEDRLDAPAMADALADACQVYEPGTSLEAPACSVTASPVPSR